MAVGEDLLFPTTVGKRTRMTEFKSFVFSHLLKYLMTSGVENMILFHKVAQGIAKPTTFLRIDIVIPVLWSIILDLWEKRKTRQFVQTT